MPSRQNRLEFNIMRSWKIIIAAAAVAVIGITVVVVRRDNALLGGAAGAATPNPATMAMPVPVTKIFKKEIPIYLDYSARTESIRNISLQAKVSGYIQQQHIPDGTDVKEGDLLYTIDPRDFQAALDLAKAQVQRDTAALDYAPSNLKRGPTLAKSGHLGQDSFDQRTSDAGPSQGRADLHRQCGRSLDRHHRRARNHRQRRSELASRPVRSHPAGHQDGARCIDGAADCIGIESAWQIRLRRRRRKQGGPA